MRALPIKPGTTVDCKGRLYSITHILDLDTVLATEIESGRPERLFIKDIKLPESNEADAPMSNEDLTVITDEDWQEANRRFSIIKPLIDNPSKDVNLVQKQAVLAGVHKATIYRWIEAYEKSYIVSSLLPKRSSGGRGKSRLSKEVEAIIQATIEDFYLTKQKKTPHKTCEEVLIRCRNANLPAPHPNTVRHRIAEISDRFKLERRESHKATREKYEPIKSHFPGAEWPLQVVQIDHTKLDIVLVDDISRRPIGRPWITLAMDVYSRMVTGFYVSFDPPCAMSVGLCIAHSILPKEKWLAKFNVSAPWPVWGVMDAIHADNAKEFRGKMLTRACEQYGINLVWRPVKTPHYGGHIERILGTFLKEIHTLPGTTFSNPKEKGEYNSEANAALTLSEFEQWLTAYITGIYHQRLHSSLNTSPIKKYEEGILGNKEKVGKGIPARIIDEERLRLDFMPFILRSVQRYGIDIELIHYYHDVLRRWVKAVDPDDPKKKRQFLIRRDPRDISKVFFFDPDVKHYYEIPYRDNSRPPISIWELHEANRRAREDGREHINEEIIFKTIEQNRAVENNAVKETKKIRRSKQRQRMNEKALVPLKGLNDKRLHMETEPTEVVVDRITPFDEIEEL